MRNVEIGALKVCCCFEEVQATSVLSSSSQRRLNRKEGVSPIGALLAKQMLGRNGVGFHLSSSDSRYTRDQSSKGQV
jgi:hypothetical protein